MTAADPFTRASPTWLHAMRHAGNTGQAFQVTGSTKLSGHIIAVVVGVAVAVLALFLDGSLT